MQPKPPRAPKQRSRADSDDELDEAEQKKIETMARAQASDELQREVQIMRDDSSSDDESEDDLGLDDDGEDIDGLDFGAEALSPSQSALVDSFLNPGGRTRTLADLIMEKIAEKEAAQHGDDDEDDDALPDKVSGSLHGHGALTEKVSLRQITESVQGHTRVRKVGGDPLDDAARRVVAALRACAATRVFASNLDPKRARTFYGDVLLERCRDDIREHRRLNYHLYQALHRALFKPAPWFKGVLLPLVKSGDCTLREALVFGRYWPRPRCPKPTRPSSS